MKQDKVDDLDDLIYDLIYKRNTLDELYEAQLHLRDRMYEMQDVIVSFKDKIDDDE